MITVFGEGRGFMRAMEVCKATKAWAAEASASRDARSVQA